jgi:hypothetical protein
MVPHTNSSISMYPWSRVCDAIHISRCRFPSIYHCLQVTKNTHTVHHTTSINIGGAQCKRRHTIKGPIKQLGKHILKYDNINNLAIIANQTHQLHKWLENDDNDKSKIK